MKQAMLALLALIAAGLTSADRYSEGQVWAYRTRPGDEGSLLKIQHIERQGNQTIYHLSVIGFHLHANGFVGVLQHEPVSRQTLDNSVVELRPDPGTFPSADEGIAEWRRARGGVYTITVAETLEVMDRTLATHQEQPAESRPKTT